MSVLRAVGKISPSSTALFLCDMQVKFQANITHFDAVVQNSNKVLNAAQHMSGEAHRNTQNLALTSILQSQPLLPSSTPRDWVPPCRR